MATAQGGGASRAAAAAAAAARAAARAPPTPGMDCGARLRVGAKVLRARGERRHVMGTSLVRVRCSFQ